MQYHHIELLVNHIIRWYRLTSRSRAARSQLYFRRTVLSYGSRAIAEKLEGLQSQSFLKVLTGSKSLQNFFWPEVLECQIS